MSKHVSPKALPPQMENLEIEEPEEKPVWNLRALVFFWIAQFIILGIRQIGGLFLILFSPAADAYTFATISSIAVWIGNALVIIAIPYQVFEYVGGTLTPVSYFRVEIAKTLWSVATLVLLVAKTGRLMPIIGIPLGVEIFINVVYFAPFWGAAYYGYRAKDSKSGYVKVNDEDV